MVMPLQRPKKMGQTRLAPNSLGLLVGILIFVGVEVFRRDGVPTFYHAKEPPFEQAMLKPSEQGRLVEYGCVLRPALLRVLSGRQTRSSSREVRARVPFFRSLFY